MMHTSFLLLPLVFPLIGGILPLLFSKISLNAPQSFVWLWVAPILNVLAAAVALSLLFLLPFKIMVFQWIHIEDLSIPWVLNYDLLSATLTCVVCSISALIQLYSVSYMKEDPRRIEFLSYLSLFTFAMLILVTADNLLQMFLGWEGVGICSYILIGFWHYKVSASNGAFKALIMNRIGDAAFILAMIWIFAVTGSLNITTILQDVATFSSWPWWIPGGFILLAAMAKSAQFGFHTWLPDAMEGPTPVSALLHAATMVTAGIYVLLRLSPLLDAVPSLRLAILFVGLITALFMALIALNQYDLKKIIAYSTSSQLGFMMIAIGLGSYSLALFHLVTHACFKSLLFLGAGTVIRHMQGEQDIRNMGGLWRQLPLTYGTFLIGSLSMAGIPFLAGYYSKEAILLYGWAEYGISVYAIGLALAFLTSAYVFKLFFLVFHGTAHSLKEKSRGSIGLQIPLVILALASIVSGYFLSPYFLDVSIKVPLAVHILPTLMALLGIGLILLCYGTKWSPLKYIWKYIEGAHVFLAHKLYLDELYTIIFVEPFKRLSKFLAEKLDLKIMDQDIFGSVPTAVSYLHEWIRGVHSGYLPSYVMWVVLGFVCILICLLRGAS